MNFNFQSNAWSIHWSFRYRKDSLPIKISKIITQRPLHDHFPLHDCENTLKSSTRYHLGKAGKEGEKIIWTNFWNIRNNIHWWLEYASNWKVWCSASPWVDMIILWLWRLVRLQGERKVLLKTLGLNCCFING